DYHCGSWDSSGTHPIF
nr:immunoglobulin light chain junction region [Macaca mulatta]